MWAKLVFYVIMSGTIIPCAVAGQASYRTIKDIDFNNFTYQYLDQAFHVEDGRYEKADKGWMESLEVVRVKFGYLTQRTHEDAVVLTRYNGGGTGLFDALYLFQLENGQPVLVTVIEGGDRAIGGIKGFYVEDETLYIVSHDSHRNACYACFDYESTTEWKWKQHKRTAGEMALGTGIGALIGAIAGGGKGAAIGAGVGAGGGTAAALISHGHEVDLPQGSDLTIKLNRPLEGPR